VSSEATAKAVPSWRAGHFVWPQGRTKLVLLGGVGSRTGDGERSFAGLIRFLAERGGYDPRRDVLEATYTGVDGDDGWQPRPYAPADTRRPLMDSAEAVASTLEWYRSVLPPASRLAVLGYSLGGVAALDGATLAVARDRAGWQERIAAVVAVAAPVRGCNAGPLIQWAWLATSEADALGVAGDDLDKRWNDPAEQQRLERRAAFLRASGARLMTLADPDDAVVRPDEAVILGPGESLDDMLVRTTRVRPGSLGHGAILDEPRTWRRVLDAIGPQELIPGQLAVEDPIETELQALKERLRRQGRI
jgi:hypothetical protein